MSSQPDRQGFHRPPDPLEHHEDSSTHILRGKVVPDRAPPVARGGSSPGHPHTASDNSPQCSPDVPAIPSAEEVDLLSVRLAEEMARRWRDGERPCVEDFLERYPQLALNPEAGLRLVCEEMCLRQDTGEQLGLADFLARFPQWRPQLEILFDCQQLIHDPHFNGNLAAFPTVGDIVGDFVLLAELGRGAMGRVFLAAQASLADRPVVLKIVPQHAREHLSLARVQHTHIVPLYSVQPDPTRHLLALCMPYFGGKTLAQLLDALAEHPPESRTTRHLLDALAAPLVPRPGQSVGPAPLPSVPAGGVASKFLARISYTSAICWIGACLADAIHYAHERDLVHLDLKPSNMLITAEGQPMLLDFHLAQKPLQPAREHVQVWSRSQDPQETPDASLPSWLGGTRGYMSPEQECAMQAVREGYPIAAAVDARSDIYSLGVVLCEALGGRVPVPEDQGKLRTLLPLRHPDVTPGLLDILARCLQPRPEDRYATAAALASDLRRHLNDLPLRGVRNRSWSERWRKWRRQHPQMLPRIILGCLALVLLGLISVSLVSKRHRAMLALRASKQHQQQGQLAESLAAAERGLVFAEGLPWAGFLRQKLQEQCLQAKQAHGAIQRQKTIQRLHEIAKGLRMLQRESTASSRQMRVLDSQCQGLWKERERILRYLECDADSPANQEIQADLLDLALLWTHLQVRLAKRKSAARERALQILDEAEQLLGPSHILYRERQLHAEALGWHKQARMAGAQARALPPRSAWEHLAVGRTLLWSGQTEQALQHFNQAIDLEPGAFAFHFSRGVCAYRLKQYSLAVRAFDVCIALTEGKVRARCFVNRALAYTALDEQEQALADYGRSLRDDPNQAQAYRNRGALHYRLQHYPEALADFRKALALSADSAQQAAIWFAMALVHHAQKDPLAARRCLQHVLQHDPDHRRARELLARLQS